MVISEVPEGQYVLFDQTIKYDDATLQIKFAGICPNEKRDSFQEEYLIQNIFANQPNYFISNVAQGIRDIRTIFRNFNETSFYIQYCTNKKNNSITLLFDHTELVYYEKNTSITNNFRFTFSRDYGYQISFPKKTDIISEWIEKEMANVDRFQFVYPKTELDRNQQALCQIYQLFYQEIPDFSLSHIEDKVQSMMYLLCEYNIWLDTDGYSFSLSSFRDYVDNPYYTYVISNLAPLGKITKSFDVIDPAMKRKIKVLGDEIRNAFQQEPDFTDAFRNFCTIDYVKKYCVRNSENFDQIAKYRPVHSTTEQVKEKIKLMDKIEETIQKMDKIQ